MTDPTEDHGAPPPGPGLPEALAGLATLAWLAAVAALWWAGPEDGTAAPALLIGAAVPVALIWLAAVTARSLRVLRAEAARLRRAIDALHDIPRPAPSTAAPRAPDLARRLDDLIAAQRRIEAALASAVAPPAPLEHKAATAAPPQPAPERQQALALGTPAEALRAPVGTADFLRALNFPDSTDDAEGFRALRRALDDPRAARIIRAAQDALTLLSEDGLYMDDLPPAPTAPALWRRFARGERGGAVAGLGAIDDPEALARAAARMREDAVFRDVAHHFLRHFDRMLESVEPAADDQALAILADTRSGRAFMLLGRVTGIFG